MAWLFYHTTVSSASLAPGPSTATLARRQFLAASNNASSSLARSASATSDVPCSTISGINQNNPTPSPLTSSHYATQNLTVRGQGRTSRLGKKQMSNNIKEVERLVTVASTTAAPILEPTASYNVFHDLVALDDVASIQSRTESANALSVLFSALPTDVVASIESEFNIPTSILAESSTKTLQTQTTQTTHTRHTSTSTHTDTTTTSPSSSSSTSTSSSSTSTNTVQSTTTSASPTSTTSAAPATSSSDSLDAGQIAGIAVGVAAGVVLILLAVAYIWRRRAQQHKPIFGARDSEKPARAYPEIAWLYDPAPTPPRPSTQHQRETSDSSLLPLHQPRSMMETSMAAPAPAPAPAAKLDGPPMRQADAPIQIPLLAPQLPAMTHEISPTNSAETNRRSEVSSTYSTSPSIVQGHMQAIQNRGSARFI